MKRARFDGPDRAVRIHYPPDAPIYDQQSVVVEQGHQLPDEVPASVRDELLKRDNWSEVDYTPPNTKKEA